MRAIDNHTPWSVCFCGRQKPREEKNCGSCPQRRASDQEAHEAEEAGAPLPLCYRCSHPVKPAIGPTAPHPDRMRFLTCLECNRRRAIRCECPRHQGDRIVHEFRAHSCAWVSRSRQTSGTVSRLTICDTCARKFKLQSWEDYCASAGSVDSNGEIQLLPGESGTLRFHRDPFEPYGGRSRVWCPARGPAGTWTVQDGEPVRPWIAFLPNGFRRIHVAGREHRILYGLRFIPGEFFEAEIAAVWHTGVNSWVDRFLDPHLSGVPSSIRTVGWLYVRVRGCVEDTERHDLAIFRHLESKGKPLHQWVSWCHAQP